MAKTKFYAVARGRATGLFTSWAHTESLVKGFAGARYKSFGSRAEAEAWLSAPQRERKKAKPAARSTDSPAPVDVPADGLVIYTDGGAINNPGPGGYGIVICDGDDRRELSGGFARTTNNRMELTACIVALESVAGCGRPIVLYSDSSYLVNGVMKGWARSWRARGWVKSDGAPAQNVDLWQRLLGLLEHEQVILRWVRGHAGNALNERCDRLAVDAARSDNLPVDAGYEKTMT